MSSESRRDESEKKAIVAAEQHFVDFYDEQVSAARESIIRLAEILKWNSAEIGWSFSDGEYIREFAAKSDLGGLSKVYGTHAKMRPRDPYPAFWKNICIGATAADPATLLNIAKDTEAQSRLIPPAGVYDDIRVAFIAYSHDWSRLARTLEIKTTEQPARSTESSQLSLKAAARLLELQPSDPTGYIRMLLATALAQDGQLPESLKLAQEVESLTKAQASMSYDYACILSLNHRASLALQFLRRSFDLGFENVPYARADRDFENLRMDAPKAFLELLRPKYDWVVTDDLLWDDVRLTNQSPFPLTNVIFKVGLVKDGTKTDLTLKCDRIEPGQTKSWQDVVNGASGRWDQTSEGNLLCDQLE